MPAESIIFHWDDPHDPRGNWQHIFEGHDVEPDEVEALIQDYWDMKVALGGRKDETYAIIGTSITGRTLKAVFLVLDHDPPRVWVATCYPLEW